MHIFLEAAFRKFIFIMMKANSMPHCYFYEMVYNYKLL